LLRNLGPMYFKDFHRHVRHSGNLDGREADRRGRLNGDDLMDLIVAREGQPPQIFIKERGGALVATNTPPLGPQATLLPSVISTMISAMISSIATPNQFGRFL